MPLDAHWIPVKLAGQSNGEQLAIQDLKEATDCETVCEITEYLDGRIAPVRRIHIARVHCVHLHDLPNLKPIESNILIVVAILQGTKKVPQAYVSALGRWMCMSMRTVLHVWNLNSMRIYLCMRMRVWIRKLMCILRTRTNLV